MGARYRSSLLMFAVLLVVLGTRIVDFGSGHEATAQGHALIFGLGAVVDVTLGLESLGSRSGYE